VCVCVCVCIQQTHVMVMFMSAERFTNVLKSYPPKFAAELVANHDRCVCVCDRRVCVCVIGVCVSVQSIDMYTIDVITR
jgi:hypothetical protein